MAVTKISGIILLLLGIIFSAVGILEYNKSRRPNTCIVDFSRSLGGKASLAFQNSMLRNRSYGIAAISSGAIFTLAGCVLLFKSKK